MDNAEQRAVAEPAKGPPVKAKLAATVLCAREGNKNRLEIMLMRRPVEDAFAGGQFVFPGGKVDEADFSERAEAVTASLPAEWPEPLAAMSAETPAAVLRAGVREVYEEAGFLATCGADGCVPPEGFPTGEEVVAAPSAFYEALYRSGLTLQLDRLIYWVNWVTPKQVPMRFDTHFLLLPVPRELALVPHREEVKEILWVSPDEALELYSRGKIELMFPTVKSLQQISGIGTLERLATRIRDFPSIRVEPSIHRTDDGGIRIVLPDAWPEPK